MVFLPEINIVRASGTIYIRSDGSVEGTDKIQRDGNIYTFTDNIYDEIDVEKDNIVVDGAGYAVQGTGSGTGIDLSIRDNVTIKNVEIQEFGEGIRLFYGSNNRIIGNNIINNDHGMYLFSSNNLLRSNSMDNNKYNFEVWGGPQFVNDVDDSNTVDGKPVYYWVNERDRTVPLDAGYVALVSCTRITVQNLNLANNWQGIVLSHTTDSTITKNHITDSYFGIRLEYSSKNRITGNHIANNQDGISLYDSSNNKIAENYITNNEDGIDIYASSNLNTVSGNTVTANNGHGIYFGESTANTVSRNNITNNPIGILFWLSSYNSIHHNNFINNPDHVFTNGPINSWFIGSEGNYWDDYTGVDNDGDGIGDTPYFIDPGNEDSYPLINIIPEFPSWTPMLLILILFTVATVIYKRRLLKTPSR